MDTIYDNKAGYFYFLSNHKGKISVALSYAGLDTNERTFYNILHSKTKKMIFVRGVLNVAFFTDFNGISDGHNFTLHLILDIVLKV